MEVPVVDFTKCGLAVEKVEKGDRKQAGDDLYAAFSTWGFAYLKGGGIPEEKVKGIYEVDDKFFSLPRGEKQKYFNRDTPTFCYDALEAIHATRDRPRDCQEGFRVTSLSDDTEWPDVPQFRERLEEFQEISRRLIERVLKALGIGMKLKDPEYLCGCHKLMNKQGNNTMIKILTYPPITERTLRENQLRIGEHSDVGSITLLFQDDIGGLQVQTPDGNFIDAHPIPGAVVLNIGDALQFWSGGKLKSTVHRVVPPTDKEKRAKIRRSIAYFSSPDLSAVMRPLCLEGDVETEGESDVPAMAWKEHMDKRLDYFFCVDK